MLADFLHHLVNPLAVIFQHLEVGGMQDDFTDGFYIILGIEQKYFLQCGDIEKGKQGGCDQQDNTGAKDKLADQTMTERLEYRHDS
jgi:hypothetical protein